MVLVELPTREVVTPAGVKVSIDGKMITVMGPMGSVKKDFSHMPLEFHLLGDKVVISARKARKREVAMLGTAAAKIHNMIKGVTGGVTYKLKVVYAHFPITVKVVEKEGKVLIENFIGEKMPRVAKIIGDVKVRVVGDEVIVQGLDVEEVSQTAANIQAATKIKDKDLRVFLDGIYIAEKNVGGEQ